MKSKLKMIISEVYTALVLINWLSRLGAGNSCIFCKNGSQVSTLHHGYSCGFSVGYGSKPICSGLG